MFCDGALSGELIRGGGVVDDAGNSGNEGGVGGFAFAGVLHQDDQETEAAVGQAEEAGVVVGNRQAIGQLSRAAGLVPQNNLRGKACPDFIEPCRGLDEGRAHEAGMLLVQQRAVENLLQQLYHRRGVGPVAIAGGYIGVHLVLGLGEVVPCDARPVDTMLYRPDAAGIVDEDVAGIVVAQG